MGACSGGDLVVTDTLPDAVKLTHPDRHPPERKGLANRVTAALLSLLKTGRTAA